jgi:MFS family permease
VSRVPFFYGWVISLGGAVNASFVLGSAQFALSTFLVPMEEELGWSRAVLFGGLSMRYLLAGLLGPVVGPWADRVNAPRIIMPVGVLLLGGSLSAVRWVDSELAFFFWYGFVGAIATALINLTMWEALVLKWFSRKRTRALVIASTGEASGPMIFPVFITVLISLFGWRDAWLWYGIIATVVLMPFSLALRTRPEQMSQTLDGLPEAPPRPAARVSTTSGPSDASMTRPEATRTSAFWMLATAFTLSGITITGFQAQWIPHFRDIGFSAGVAASAVGVYGFFNILARVLWGSLTLRFPLKTLMTAHAIAAGSGIAVLLWVVNNEITLFIWASYQGLVLGSFFSLFTLISAEYFGRAHIGAIRGVMMPPSSVSRAGGALLLGALRDVRGSYTLSFTIVLISWGLVVALIASSRRPRRSR